MNNRVATAIAKMEKQIAERLANGQTTAEAIAKTDRALDMDFLEYVRFQELKSLAFANERLTLDEANLIYSYLGNSVSMFNDQPVHVKAVLTRIFAELLGAD